tara:strand:- start:3968 stop:6091 length:2124 start_codon:yes stop_codon:yes gene_type:complete
MPYIANPLEGLPIRNSFITDQANLGATPATDDTLIIYDISATALKQLTIANLQASIVASPTFTGVPAGPTANAGTDTTQLATTAFVTAATTALNTVSEMTDVTISGIASGEVLKWNGSAWINQTLAEANILPVAGPTFTGVLTVGSAALSEADLEQIDDLTAGTAVASKALVVDANKDIGTIRNLTIDGVFTDGNYTFATDGSVTGLGAITSTGVVTATGFTIGSAVIAESELEMIDGITAGTAAASKALVLDASTNITGIGTISAGAITSSGIIKTDATTNATSITDGSLQTDGGLSVTLDTILGDDLTLISDAAVVNFGVNSDVSLTHVHDTGLLLNSSRKIQFGDAGTFIHQSADGVLTIESDTTVDINGAVVFAGALSGITTLGASGIITSAGLTMGSATMVEADLERVEDITPGTAAVNKAVVLDGSKNIATIGTIGSGAITSSGVVSATGFTIGNASIVEVDLEQIEDITAGTAAASKALVLDASANITGIGTIGSGAVTSSGLVTGTGFTAGNAVLAEAELELLDGITTVGTAVASKVVTADANVDTTGQRNLTISGELDAATGDFSGAVDIAGALTLSGADMDASDQNIANIKTATFVDEHDNGNSGTSDTIDWREGLKQKTTMNGNCTYTFTAPAGPCNLMLACYQDGTARTITWPSTVKWPASTAPTFTGTNGVRDIIAFYYDGTHYFGQASLAFPA